MGCGGRIEGRSAAKRRLLPKASSRTDPHLTVLDSQFLLHGSKDPILRHVAGEALMSFTNKKERAMKARSSMRSAAESFKRSCLEPGAITIRPPRPIRWSLGLSVATPPPRARPPFQAMANEYLRRYVKSR